MTAAAPVPALAPHEVQLWCFFYEDAFATDDSLATRYDTLITPDERERVRAFRFEKHQRQSLASRALVRTVLSHHAAVAPTDWRFEAGTNGKPFIAPSPGQAPLHFNLAHTQGLVVCAVSCSHERLGVDVEAFDRRASAADISESHFTPAENALLRRVPAEHRHHAFLRLWTLKESFIKATGDGLSTPLDQFGFEIEPLPMDKPCAVPARFQAAPNGLTERTDHWRFVQWRLKGPHGDFAVALGADTASAPLRCRVFEAVPLRRHAERPDLAFTAI